MGVRLARCVRCPVETGQRPIDVREFFSRSECDPSNDDCDQSDSLPRLVKCVPLAQIEGKRGRSEADPRDIRLEQ